MSRSGSSLLRDGAGSATFDAMVAGGLSTAGIKREHGEAYPAGTETVAAPATVSGKLSFMRH